MLNEVFENENARKRLRNARNTYGKSLILMLNEAFIKAQLLYLWHEKVLKTHVNIREIPHLVSIALNQ